jgi:acetyl-CoA carboxylase carboxyl transferase subunit alpha
MKQNGRSLCLDFEVPIQELEKKIEELENFSKNTDMDLSGQLKQLRERCNDLKREIFRNLNPWQRIQLARHPQRPLTMDYINLMLDDFVELYGDRTFSDDKAIVTGFGKIGGRRILVVGHRKGRSTKDRIACNFGSAHPEGYRKALHKMGLASKFHIPILTLIDTPGAYPGVGSEERGQAHAIARNLFEMSRLRVPVICVVLGEGGSGGALGIGVGDRILMLENAYYSVISPEGCAAILWKSSEKAPEAAEILRCTAEDLKKFGVIDEIVLEPLGGAHRNHPDMARSLKEVILRHLKELRVLPEEDLLRRRYEKLRAVGAWIEERRERIQSSGETVGGTSKPEEDETARRASQPSPSHVRPESTFSPGSSLTRKERAIE